MDGYLRTHLRSLKDSPWLIALIIALIGSVIIFLSYVFDLPAWIQTIVTTIGTTVLASALVGWVLFLIDVQKFFIRLMVNLSRERSYLKRLKRDELDQLAETVILAKYDMPEQIPGDNLYHFIHEEILDKHFRPDKVFFENYTEDVEIREEGQEGIKIQVERTITAKTLSETPVEDVYTLTMKVSEIPGRAGNHFIEQGDYITVNGENILNKALKEGRGEQKTPLGRRAIQLPISFTASRDKPAEIKVKQTLFESKHEQVYHVVFYKPTHGFKLKLSVFGPKQCNFEHRSFALFKPDPQDVSQTETSLTVHYRKWILPENAFEVRWKF
jgi:hypothetical protein